MNDNVTVSYTHLDVYKRQVAGLLAKPTVDILLEVDAKDKRPQIVEKLTSEGWRLMDEGESPYFKLVFNKGYTPQGFAEKVFHLHVREYGDWDAVSYTHLWQHLDPGVRQSYLVSEHQKAMAEQVTPDCRFGKCSVCGICQDFDPNEHRTSPLSYPL